MANEAGLLENEIRTPETVLKKGLKGIENKSALRVNYGTTDVLKMTFVVMGGRTCTWNLKYPKTGLTKVQVAAFMNSIISDDAISYNGFEATEIKDAYIYETQYVELQ